MTDQATKQKRLQLAAERAYLLVLEAQRDVLNAEYRLKNAQAIKAQADADLVRFGVEHAESA